jgi:serine protease Do
MHAIMKKAGFLIGIVFASSIFLQAQPPRVPPRMEAAGRPDGTLGSFAPIVRDVAPSVVNIFTTRTVRMAIPETHPLFRHPFFREFFREQPEQQQQQQQQSPRQRQQQNLGSGLIVTEDGYILTNNHVVEGADEVRVALPGSGREYIATVVGTDPPSDIAVLKIEGSQFPTIPLADSDAIEVGDLVLAIGNPFGVGQTVTMGIVSATGRGGFGIVDYEDFVQTDASINPGNSGGPLVDTQGRVIAINTAIISSARGGLGIGFAVPVNMARSIMERIIQEGRVVRGYLGVSTQPVTESLARAFGLPTRTGALVADVLPGTPAAQAGLQPGDIIVEFEGRPTPDPRQLRLIAAQTRPGTKVQLNVIRDGRERTVTTTLAELPQDPEESPAPQREPEPEPEPDVFDGVGVTNLDPTTRQRLGIPPNVEGALVLRVSPGSPAATAGLRAGDVIIEINRRPVRNAREAIRASREEAPGGTVLLRVWSREGPQQGIRYMTIPVPNAR